MKSVAKEFWFKYKQADYFKRKDLLKELTFLAYLKEDAILIEAFYSSLQSYIDDIIDGDD
jgi:hypothetical protein